MGVFGGGAVFPCVSKTLTQWLALFSHGQFLQPTEMLGQARTKNWESEPERKRLREESPSPTPVPQCLPSNSPPTLYMTHNGQEGLQSGQKHCCELWETEATPQAVR